MTAILLGSFPFIDELNLQTLEKKRISRKRDRVENWSFIDSKQERSSPVGVALNSLTTTSATFETNCQYSAYAFENRKKHRGVHKEMLHYQREDGVKFTGTLYLPLGYDRKERKITPDHVGILRNKDRGSAGQTSTNPNAFTYLLRQSGILGNRYAVLDGFFPHRG